MHITAALTAFASVVTAGTIAIASPPNAAADNYPNIKAFGTPESLVDSAGTVVTGWRVYDLHPSRDIISWPVRGRLWEATATVHADRGTVTPIITDFNARASDGQTYEAIPAASRWGINPATLRQGGTSTGKLYFDVVGPPPNGVVYDAGGRDLLFWVR